VKSVRHSEQAVTKEETISQGDGEWDIPDEGQEEDHGGEQD